MPINRLNQTNNNQSSLPLRQGSNASSDYFPNPNINSHLLDLLNERDGMRFDSPPSEQAEDNLGTDPKAYFDKANELDRALRFLDVSTPEGIQKAEEMQRKIEELRRRGEELLRSSRENNDQNSSSSHARGSGPSNKFFASQSTNGEGLTPSQLYDRAQELFSQAIALWRENPIQSQILRNQGEALMKEAMQLSGVMDHQEGGQSQNLNQNQNNNSFGGGSSNIGNQRPVLPTDFGGGGGIGIGGDGGGGGFTQSTGNGFIDAAKAILRAVRTLMVSGVGNNNPFFNIAKLLTGKSMVEVAKTFSEAGMTDEVVNQSPMLKHEALLVDTQAAGLRGIFETAIQYWNQTAQANKQIEKDTHQLAQRA